MATTIEQTPIEMRQSTYRISSKDFEALLSEIIAYKGYMYKLKEALAPLKKSDKGIQMIYTDNTGTPVSQVVFTKNDFKSLDAQLNKKIKDLKKYFTESKKKKRIRKPVDQSKPKVVQGFFIPVKVNQAMQQFFAQANLGYLDPT